MNPEVVQLEAQTDYALLLTFANGERRLFDAKPYLERGVFRRLKDQSLFKRAKVVAGSVEWPGELDLSYDTLYLRSQAIGSTEQRDGATNAR
jgi:hypothetical protein